MNEHDIRAEIERNLWKAIDLIAASLVKPDPKIWDHLLIYRPQIDPALTSAEGQHE
jgi:hypothetical protein